MITQFLRSKISRLNFLMATYFPIWSVRRAFLASINVIVGEGSRIELGTIVRGDTVIGKNSYIGYGCELRNRVRIGDFVHMSGYCYIGNAEVGDYVFIAATVFFSDDPSIGHGHIRQIQKGVKIERGARIAGHVMTLPGVTIGEGSIVGACSLVTKDVKPHTMVLGIPAREVEDKRGLLKEEIVPPF